MHQGRLTKQFCQVNFTKGAFVAAIIPCSPFGKDMMSHVAKVLFDRRTEVVSQHHRFKRSEVASPPVQSEEHAFEDEFTVLEEDDVHQIIIEEHADGNGVCGQHTSVVCRRLQGRWRTLNEQPRWRDKLAYRQTLLRIEFNPHVVQSHLV